jgi:hypothetical protein
MTAKHKALNELREGFLRIRRLSRNPFPHRSNAPSHRGKARDRRRMTQTYRVAARRPAF